VYYRAKNTAVIYNVEKPQIDCKNSTPLFVGKMKNWGLAKTLVGQANQLTLPEVRA